MPCVTKSKLNKHNAELRGTALCIISLDGRKRQVCMPKFEDILNVGFTSNAKPLDSNFARGLALDVKSAFKMS